MSLFRGILVVDQKQLKYGLTEGDLEDLQGVWFNWPSIKMTKESRHFSISNPPAHGFKWIKATKTIPKTLRSL